MIDMLRMKASHKQGSEAAVMDVPCFLCVSLGSSTVQLHDSLGSRYACANSGASFGIQSGDRA
jgi:hypothetical protein